MSTTFYNQTSRASRRGVGEAGSTPTVRVVELLETQGERRRTLDQESMSFPPIPDTGARPPGHGFVVGPDDGDAYWWLGSLTLTKLRGSDTHDGVDIVDHRVPAGYAPPRHVHSEQDEVFYIISGQFDVRCGDQSWEAGPGDLVFLPRHVPHSFAVSSDGPGRTLLINAPAGFAEVIVELGQTTTDLQLPGPDVALPSPDRIAAVSEAHGIHPA